MFVGDFDWAGYINKSCCINLSLVMKKAFLFLAFTFSLLYSYGQINQHDLLIKKADSLYKAKDFKNSAFTYSEAFKANGWKSTSNNRYNAACSWALANVADSAFYNLNRIARMMNYKNYGHITTDTDLASLHSDARWNPLLVTIKANKDKAEANLNKPLAQQLDSIYVEDQKYRKQLDAIGKQFGWNSKEIAEHWAKINKKDSLNVIAVSAILDKYGWLGEDVVGGQGGSALFLVIQHSDQQTQEKYLPMMREAVKNKKASGSSLAMLEDRVALKQGKRQIYGSQLMTFDGEPSFFQPIEDPDNVDKRRAEVGLPPLSEYAGYFQIKWDLEQYKKDLPALEEKLNARRNAQPKK